MATYRQAYLAKLLESKFGTIGKVAGRYVTAGLHVTLRLPTRLGPVDIFAQGAGQKLAIEVLEKSEGAREKAEKLVKKAELLKAKPVLVLYGDCKVNLSELAGLGVKVKRVTKR